MEKLKHRLQKLRDLQQKKHEAYLVTQARAKKLQADSFRLIWKVEKAKELLMR